MLFWSTSYPIQNTSHQRIYIFTFLLGEKTNKQKADTKQAENKTSTISQSDFLAIFFKDGKIKCCMGELKPHMQGKLRQRAVVGTNTSSESHEFTHLLMAASSISLTNLQMDNVWFLRLALRYEDALFLHHELAESHHLPESPSIPLKSCKSSYLPTIFPLES